MWYIVWVLSTLLACGCGIVTAMWLDAKQSNDTQQSLEDH